MPSFIENGTRFSLQDPKLAPNSAGYLWNRSMMIQMNSRGYAVAQYMDPEPRKYAHVPTIPQARPSCSRSRATSRTIRAGSSTFATMKQVRSFLHRTNRCAQNPTASLSNPA